MIRTKLPLAFTGVLFSLLSWHCTKIDTTNLGGGLIPAVDNVFTFDTTLSVVANNYDSVPFGKECATVYPTDDHALGFINDPMFGTTKATIFTELKPATFPFSFDGKPADRTIDSIVLVLSYRRSYGDTTANQRVEVREITGTFNPDSSTCSTYPFNFTVLGSTTYQPQKLRDTIRAFRDTTNMQLRIRLSNTFGQGLLSQDTIKTDSAFKVLLKGFAIIPDVIGNALNYFSIVDTKTKLAFYYKFKRTGLSDSATVNYFGLYATDKSANTIAKSRTGAELNSVTNNNTNPAGDNFVYLQTTPGSFALLKIPGLPAVSNRIVHRAELVMEQVAPTGLDNIFTPPNVLFLDIKDSANGEYHPVPCDFTLADGAPDITTYGGFKTMRISSGNTVARYTFNISRYVQKVITNRRANAVLRLRAPNYVITKQGYTDECGISISPLIFALNNVALGRVKLVAGTNPAVANRLRLHIVYSRL